MTPTEPAPATPTLMTRPLSLAHNSEHNCCAHSIAQHNPSREGEPQASDIHDAFGRGVLVEQAEVRGWRLGSWLGAGCGDH